MTPNDRLELVLSLARVVHVNGQSTDETMAAAERLGKALDLHAWIIPRWGELQLQAGGGDATLRLVAVCPCMILVPGPHVLNGMIDLAAARIHLGVSRLVFAGLVILAISGGLLLGLQLLGVSLPVGEPGRAVALWLDTIAAGVA